MMKQPNFLRHFCFSALALTTLIFCSAEDVVAQAPAANPGLPANSQPISRPMYVQGAVVVLLMGAAVYAVCRSSSRV